MAVQTRSIKRRIKSVKNTRKITKAMELVAASKMRKAVNSVLSSRPYSKLAWETVLAIGVRTDESIHPLLRSNKNTKKILLVLITSDRGLAGGFNTNIIRKTREIIRAYEGESEIETICIGKRGADAMRRMKLPIIASFLDITNRSKYEEILPIGRMIIDEFVAGKYKKVLVAYTDFISAVMQEPIILELLPLSHVESKDLGKASENKTETSAVHAKMSGIEFTFEPSPNEVLESMLPRLIQTMIYQAVLESAASEHSSRMMAMRNASDSAGEMIDDLTFTFNQARQASITQEIAEISSGKAALEN